jgi:hypothetical protein
MAAMTDFDLVWRRITMHAGQTFRLVRGGEFVYRVEDNKVFHNRTDVAIPRDHFARAWSLIPLSGPGEINREVVGPSYVYAILTDPRITERTREPKGRRENPTG